MNKGLWVISTVVTAAVSVSAIYILQRYKPDNQVSTEPKGVESTVQYTEPETDEK